MNSEFENKLAGQALRAPPPEWRADILRTATADAAKPAADIDHGWLSWLWPAPQAWAALAACWVVLLAVHSLSQPAPIMMANRVDAAQLTLALAEKRRALMELDVAVFAKQTKPAAPHAPAGSSSWIREEKGTMSC